MESALPSRAVAGLALRSVEEAVHRETVPHRPVCLSEQGRKGSGPLLPAPFPGQGRLDGCGQHAGAAVEGARLCRTGLVVSRLSSCRFKTSPLSDPLGSLEPCACLDSVCEGVDSWKCQVILMIIAPRGQRRKEGLVSQLPDAGMPSGLLLLVKAQPGCVCSSEAATDL